MPPDDLIDICAGLDSPSTVFDIMQAPARQLLGLID